MAGASHEHGNRYCDSECSEPDTELEGAVGTEIVGRQLTLTGTSMRRVEEIFCSSALSDGRCTAEARLDNHG